ncbi:MAG: hypothetical protein M1823_008153 [Watsoniomyces obsoletus]|nr:MAG: hypothetical protein M1823_008153 [Watsoniomyces obsoletus]
MTATVLANLQAASIDKASSDLIDAQGPEARWLIASPYLDQDHLLDLETLGTQDRLFAIALSSLHPATEDYAVVKYEDVFDFSALMAQLRVLVAQHSIRWKRQDFYVVEFRSQVKAEYDNDRLSFLDKESHKEAVASGGLLKYWFGIPNGDRKNLATCT